MSVALSKSEKRKFLKALEKDEEFRYAVAGLLGFSEMLRKLDVFEENQEKLWIEVKSLRENQEKLWIEVKSLRESQEKLWIEVKNLRENQEKLWIEVKSLRESQERLWQNQEKLWMEVKSLRENQEYMLVELRDLRVSVERLTLSVEDEARDVVKHRLKAELNVDIPLDRVWVDGKEIDIYGASDELCVFGEATVRLGVKMLDELEDKINLVGSKRPELLKPKLIKVIYTDYVIPSALEYAKAKGIWVLKWSGDLTPRVIHKT
ncbi:MAG: hypothetical protein QW158_07030 [Nitrososphaerales archaeon]